MTSRPRLRVVPRPVEISDRRLEPREALVGDELLCDVKLSDGRALHGVVRNLSRGGFRVVIEHDDALDALRSARLVRVTIRTAKQQILTSEMAVAYTQIKGARSVAVGLSFLFSQRGDVPQRSENHLDRRVHARRRCELPGELADSVTTGVGRVPVVVTDLSDSGCRVFGVQDSSRYERGAVIELGIRRPGHPLVLAAVRLASSSGKHELGVEFVRSGQDLDKLDALIEAVQYPDLVLANSSHASGIWEVVRDAGYFRERAQDRYDLLRESAVECWSRLGSDEARPINRSIISSSTEGAPRSVTQVTKFYPRTWLGHHLAAAGDATFRARVVPQHHGMVHDTVESLGASYFLVYYNASHKGQSGLYRTLQARFPDADLALTEVACFDVDAAVGAGAPAQRGIVVRQVGEHACGQVAELVQRLRDPVAIRALGVLDDFELTGLEREYATVGLHRRRAWYAARDESGRLLGAVSLDLAPVGFNLTSIGNHALVYMQPGLDLAVADAATRELVRYCSSHFRHVGRRWFLLMALQPQAEALHAMGLPFLAQGHEFVVGTSMFPTLTTFITGAYQERSSPEVSHGGR